MKLVLFFLALVMLAGAPQAAVAAVPTCRMSTSQPAVPVGQHDADCCKDNCFAPCLSAVLTEVGAQPGTMAAFQAAWCSGLISLLSIKPIIADPPPKS